MAMSVCWKVTNFKQQLQMHMKHQTKQKQFQVKLFWLKFIISYHPVSPAKWCQSHAHLIASRIDLSSDDGDMVLLEYTYPNICSPLRENKFSDPLPGGSRQCVYISLYQKSTSWDGTAPKAYECPIAKRKGSSFSPAIFQVTVTLVRFRGSICPFHQQSLAQRKQSCCTCDLGHNHRHILR